MIKPNRVVKMASDKTTKSFVKISTFQNGFAKSIKTTDKRKNKRETSRMFDSKWPSQISNDSAFCSTETAIVDFSRPSDDEEPRDRAISNLSLDGEDFHQSSTKDVEASKSHEDLSKSRLSIDGSSCSSLPFRPFSSPSQKASLENVSSTRKKNKLMIFKRSTSFDSQADDNPRLGLMQTFQNAAKKTSKQQKKIFTERHSGETCTSLVDLNELHEFEIWASKRFLEGKYLEFQIKRIETFLNTLREGRKLRESELRAVVLLPPKSDERDNSDYQKCLIRIKVTMQYKCVHLFLFEDFLMIARQRKLGMSHMWKIKERIPLLFLWVLCSHSHLSLPNQFSLTVGWSLRQIKVHTLNFENSTDRLLFVNVVLKQQEQVAKAYEEELVIKVFCDDKDHGKRTKKIVIKRTETIDDVMEKVPVEFFPTKSSKESQFQFYIKYVGESDKYFLTGSESLYSIQLSSNKKMSNEVEYFSIIPVKNGSFLKKSHSCKRSKQNKVYESSHASTKSEANPIVERNLQDIFRENNEYLPKVILDLFQVLYEKGPEVDGIFRKSSNQREVQVAQESMNDQERESFLRDLNPCMASSLLKSWLKNMSDCLLVGKTYQKWLDVVQLEKSKRIQEIKTLVDQLPKENRLVLQYLMSILRHIADNCEVNKMTSHNLAVCIGPSILNNSTFADYETEADARKNANIVVETMIEHAAEIFGESHLENKFRRIDEITRPNTGAINSKDAADVQKTFGSLDLSYNDLAPSCVSVLQDAPPSLSIDRSDLKNTPNGQDFESDKRHDECPPRQNSSPHVDVPSSSQHTMSAEDSKLETSYMNNLDIKTSDATARRQQFYSSVKRYNQQKLNTLINHSKAQKVPQQPHLGLPSGYCHKTSRPPISGDLDDHQKESPRKIPKRRETMPGEIFCPMYTNCLKKKCNQNEKPHYVVEVVLNPTRDTKSNRDIIYHRGPKLGHLNNSQKTDDFSQINVATSKPRKFKTTIYLGPGGTSFIEEPSRTNSLQGIRQLK